MIDAKEITIARLKGLPIFTAGRKFELAYRHGMRYFMFKFKNGFGACVVEHVKEEEYFLIVIEVSKTDLGQFDFCTRNDTEVKTGIRYSSHIIIDDLCLIERFENAW